MNPPDTDRVSEQATFLATNLKRLRSRKAWRQQDVAEKLGISRATIAFLETGKTKNPSILDVMNFATLYGISTDSLLRFDLRKFSEEQMKALESGDELYTTGAKLRILATTVDKENNENIEYVPIKAKAGYVGGFADPEYISTLPRYTFPGLSKNSKYRLFPTTGDSMLPFPEGCYIISEYVEDWTTIKDGTICVLILKNGGADFVFKEIENRIKDTKQLVAKSLNPLYKPFVVPIDEVLEIWRYKAHLSESITMNIPDTPMERLIGIMQDMRTDIASLTVDKRPRQ